MEKLVLGSYTWDHPQSEVEQIWDFSRLRSLCLDNNILQFLKCAPLKQMTQLESLKLSGLGSVDHPNWNPALFRSVLGAVLGELKI